MVTVILSPRRNLISDQVFSKVSRCDKLTRFFSSSIAITLTVIVSPSFTSWSNFTLANQEYSPLGINPE